MEITVTTRSALATRRVAGALARALRPPAVLALHGDLGAGKTTFVQGLVHALPGGKDLRVQSPTFALARTYPTRPPVHHVDLYRLDDEEAARHLGIEEMVGDPEALSCVEWAERGPGLLPAERLLHIRLEGIGRRRRIRLEGDTSVVEDTRALKQALRAAKGAPAGKVDDNNASSPSKNA